jgi:CP family cyanate transporter-like MFS transporter
MLTAFAAGVGIAVASPLLSGYVKRHFDGRAPAMVGLYSVAMVLGASLSAGLTVPVQHMLGESWKWALAFWAALAFIALPVWWFGVLRDKDVQTAQNSGLSGLGRLPLKNKRAWMLTLFFGCMATLFYSMTAWIAPISTSMGFSSMDSAAMLTLFSLVQLPINIFIPVLLQRFSSKLPLLVGCALLELTGLLLLITLPGMVWIAVVLIGVGAGGLFPIALTIPVDETETPQDASAWSAMSQSGGYIIGAAGPFAVGLLHDVSGGFIAPLLMLAVVAAVMLSLQIGFSRRESRHTADIKTQTPSY